MTSCPHCGEGMHGELLDGLCPRALLELALAPEVPSQVGEYEIVAEIARGGMGVVYRARQLQPERLVALKMIQLGAFASRDAMARFVHEVELLARFEHPNIVRIYDARGMHGAHPFYTMQLVAGGSLADHGARFRDPRKAMRLMATVARAVQFCHDARPMPVLHRDIKPANILLGPDDHPYLTDFGIAKSLEQIGATHTGTLIGTVAYMAPEIVLGQPASSRSEVYALGAVLHELITGAPPFAGASLPELLRSIVDDPLVPLRQRVRDLDRGLDLVCRTAMQKSPGRRYASAGEFADDLERVLRGESPAPPQTSRFRRTLAWTRRHPWVSVGLGGLLVWSSALAVTAFWMLRTQDRALLDSARQIDTFAARAQAGAVLRQLHDHAQRLREIADGLSPPTSAPGSDECPASASALLREADGFDALTLFTRDGQCCARWPSPASVLQGRTFAFRDYFQGAVALADAGRQGAYLSPAYHAESERAFKFALATPVLDHSEGSRGVLLGTLATNSVLGAIALDDQSRSGRITALIAPRGAERADLVAGPGQHYVVLVHPGLSRHSELRLEPRAAEAIHARFGPSAAPGEQFAPSTGESWIDDDYRDPVPGYEGRWLASFAPVGRTGYVVLVQMRYADATGASRALAQMAARIGALAGVCLVGLWLLTARLQGRRMNGR